MHPGIATAYSPLMCVISDVKYNATESKDPQVHSAHEYMILLALISYQLIKIYILEPTTLLWDTAVRVHFQINSLLVCCEW